MPSQVPPSIAVFGRRTKEDRWMAEQSTLGFGNAPGTRSDFRSICIAFAMPLRLFGRSAIQRTCEEQRIFLGIPHLEQRKSTMSWRSPVSQVGRSPEQLAVPYITTQQGAWHVSKGRVEDGRGIPRQGEASKVEYQEIFTEGSRVFRTKAIRGAPIGSACQKGKPH